MGRGLDRYSYEVNRLFPTKLRTELDPRKYRQLIATQSLQFLNARHVHCVVIRNRHYVEASSTQTIDNLLVGQALVLVVEGCRGMKVQVPLSPG